LSGIDVADGRGRGVVVDLLEIATSLDGGAQVGQVGHAITVGAPDGFDGTCDAYGSSRTMKLNNEYPFVVPLCVPYMRT